MELASDGAVTGADVVEIRPADATVSDAFERAVLAALRRARFRPARHDGAPRAGAFHLQLVFHPDLGLIPVVPPESCEADDALLDGPAFVNVDERARLATPVWERSRIIADTWPVVLQKGEHQYRLWFLVDRRGRVCEARPTQLQPIEDPWIRSKVMEIAGRLRYHPARADGTATAVWHQELLVFSF